MAICRVCSVDKPETLEFWSGVSGKLRLTQCKKCKSKASSEARRKNKVATNASNKAWKLRNKQGNAEINKAWRLANIEKARLGPLLWAKRHPDRHNAKYAKRRAAKLQRTPMWLIQDDLLLIEAKYAVARWLSDVVGVPYHVDHNIPLLGELVSGLHVPDNLTILQGIENLSKKNKYEVA